jgi:hypothetical protein
VDEHVVELTMPAQPARFLTALAHAAAVVIIIMGVAPWRTVNVATVARAAGADETAAFSMKVGDEVSPYRERSAFVLPSESLAIEAVGGPEGEYRLEAGDDEGLVVPLNGNPIYKPPAGFVEVTRDNEDARLTPHFRLKQFLCKQEPVGQYPKYVVLEERLLLELEAVLELVNTMGFDVDTLHVMSAYRTPYYNKAIGDVLYSMHQWGRAADIFIDKDDKFRMDDLNRDSRVDINDSRYLADQIERLLLRPAFRRFEGGIGVYPATSAHPPFVHVDVRGTRARW